MSYHVRVPRRVTRPPRTPAPYPLYPLSNAQPLPPGIKLVPLQESASWWTPNRKMMAGIAIVIFIIALLVWLDRRDEPPPRRRRSDVKKQSTAQMAKNLYERLKDRGGIDETTMRSLAQLARNA